MYLESATELFDRCNRVARSAVSQSFPGEQCVEQHARDRLYSVRVTDRSARCRNGVSYSGTRFIFARHIAPMRKIQDTATCAMRGDCAAPEIRGGRVPLRYQIRTRSAGAT